MKINPNKVDIMTSGVSKAHYPTHGLPEIALAGRSNVGKSTFINAITGRKSVARVSSKPGKTQTLNFFNLDDQLVMVDVPGYGYAKESKAKRAEWGKMIEEYFVNRECLKVVIQLVDLRHNPTEDDVLMYDFLKHYEIPTIVIATKEDKLTKNNINKQQKNILHSLQLEEGDEFMTFSSVKKDKVDDVWNLIAQFIGR